jgi:hypothetical protein
MLLCRKSYDNEDYSKTTPPNGLSAYGVVLQASVGKNSARSASYEQRRAFDEQWDYWGGKLIRSSGHLFDSHFWNEDFIGKIVYPLLDDTKWICDISKRNQNTGLRLMCDHMESETTTALHNLTSNQGVEKRSRTIFQKDFWGNDLTIISSFKNMQCWCFTAIDKKKGDKEVGWLTMPAFASAELRMKQGEYKWTRLSYTTTTVDCITTDLNPIALYGEEYRGFKAAVWETVGKYPFIASWGNDYYRLPHWTQNEVVAAMDKCYISLAKKVVNKCIEYFERQDHTNASNSSVEVEGEDSSENSSTSYSDEEGVAPAMANDESEANDEFPEAEAADALQEKVATTTSSSDEGVKTLTHPALPELSLSDLRKLR